MAQLPRLLGFLGTPVLNEAAIVIIIEGPHKLLDRSVGQEDGCTLRSMLLPVPCERHHGSSRCTRRVTCPQQRSRCVVSRSGPSLRSVTVAPHTPTVAPARRDQLAVHSYTMDLHQQGHHCYIGKEVERVTRYTPRELLGRQASRHPSIIVAGNLPTELLGQILCDLIPALSHCPAPSPQGAPAIEESGPQIKASQYVTISLRLEL